MWTHKDMFGVTALTSTNANLTHEKYLYRYIRKYVWVYVMNNAHFCGFVK